MFYKSYAEQNEIDLITYLRLYLSRFYGQSLFDYLADGIRGRLPVLSLKFMVQLVNQVAPH